MPAKWSGRYSARGTRNAASSIMTTVPLSRLPHMPDTAGTATITCRPPISRKSHGRCSRRPSIDRRIRNSDTGRSLTEPRYGCSVAESESSQSRLFRISIGMPRCEVVLTHAVRRAYRGEHRHRRLHDVRRWAAPSSHKFAPARSRNRNSTTRRGRCECYGPCCQTIVPQLVGCNSD